MEKYNIVRKKVLAKQMGENSFQFANIMDFLVRKAAAVTYHRADEIVHVLHIIKEMHEDLTHPYYCIIAFDEDGVLHCDSTQKMYHTSHSFNDSAHVFLYEQDKSVCMLTEINLVPTCNIAILENVQEWYKENYPSDNCYVYAPNATFLELINCMYTAEQEYDFSDSCVRERVFQKLSVLLHCDYDDIYDLW